MRKRDAGEENGRGYGSGTGSEQEGREAAAGCGEETKVCGIQEEGSNGHNLFRECRTSHSYTVLRTMLRTPFHLCVPTLFLSSALKSFKQEHTQNDDVSFVSSDDAAT